MSYFPEHFFKTYAEINFAIDVEQQNTKIATPTLNSIGIDFSLPDRGFHIKANKDIKVGELLVVERPYAGVLLGEHIETNCFECMLHLDPSRMNVTYCRQCATVQYCSRACEKSAWKGHHKYECKYIKLLAHDSGLNHMEWLALRIVLRAGNENLLSMKSRLEEYEASYEHLNRIDSTADVFFQELFSPEYRSDSYLSIFNLVTNSAVRKLNDLFRRSFIALLFVKLLYKVNFMNQSLDESKNGSQNGIFIGGLILRHLQSISCNAHEVSRLSLCTELVKQPMAKSFANGIGAGIYALLSMFNHSCDPHVTRTFRGSTCQVRAIRAIAKNEEVYDNYGVIYAVNELADRQKTLLDQYFFECRCKPCADNWPLFDKLEHVLHSSFVVCDACKSEKKRKTDCEACIAQLDNVKLLQLDAQMGLNALLKFNHRMDLSDPALEKFIKDIYGYYCKYLQALDTEKIKRPFRDYNNYEEALKQLLNLINIKPNVTE